MNIGETIFCLFKHEILKLKTRKHYEKNENKLYEIYFTDDEYICIFINNSTIVQTEEDQR